MDEAGIPAVNELRNAGRHLIDALADDGSTAHQQHLQLGIAHCRRACYEAYEAGILFALEVINKFREDYARVPVDGVIPNYTEILIKALEAQKSAEAGRDPNFNREQDHTVRMNAFRDLRGCAEKLIVGREEMNKKVAEKTATASTNAKVLGVGLLGIAAAILLAIWTATGFWVPWHQTTAQPPALDQPAPATPIANDVKPATPKALPPPTQNSK